MSLDVAEVAVASQRTMAKKLGVSHMTVSRALRGENGISEETRRRIVGACRRAGLPLPPARKESSAKLMHVLCSMAPAPSQESAFHSRLLSGLQQGGRECGADVANFPAIGASECWPLMVDRKQADGVIVVWGDEHNPMPHTGCPIPAVFVFHGPPRADVVNADNFMGGYRLGVHLAGLGHRRVAFFGPSSLIGMERLSGLRIGLATQGGACPDELVLTRGSPFSWGKMWVDLLLEKLGHTSGDLPGLLRGEGGRAKPFTALMAYDDYLAAQGVLRLRELGLRVPDDVSVVGFDGVVPTWYDGPRLTTCAIPLEELGAEAARMVYWRLEHPDAGHRKVELETELVEGESCGRRG